MMGLRSAIYLSEGAAVAEKTLSYSHRISVALSRSSRPVGRRRSFSSSHRRLFQQISAIRARPRRGHGAEPARSRRETGAHVGGCHSFRISTFCRPSHARRRAPGPHISAANGVVGVTFVAFFIFAAGFLPVQGRVATPAPSP